MAHDARLALRRARRTGVLVCIVTVLLAAGFLAGLARQSYWALAVPVAAGVLGVLTLAFWIGYTINTVRGIPAAKRVTTPPGAATPPIAPAPRPALYVGKLRGMLALRAADLADAGLEPLRCPTIAIAPPESDGSRRSSKGFNVTNTMPALALLVKPLIDSPGKATACSTPGCFIAMSPMRRITSSVRSSVAPSGNCAKPIRYCLSWLGTKPWGTALKRPTVVAASAP